MKDQSHQSHLDVGNAMIKLITIRIKESTKAAKFMVLLVIWLQRTREDFKGHIFKHFRASANISDKALVGVWDVCKDSLRPIW